MSRSDRRPTSTRRRLLPLALVLAASGCATPPSPQLHRSETLPIAAPAPPRSDSAISSANPITSEVAISTDREKTPTPSPASETRTIPDNNTHRPRFHGEAASLNFSDESVQAVARAILGEMLHQPYVIAPGVQGTVTLINPDPVSPEAALRLLERALISNGLRLLHGDGGFLILPEEQARASGLVAPGFRTAGDGIGYASRIVPLRWIGAAEMEKLLKPYARPAAILDVDTARNRISLAGSQEELDNYQRIVDTFDVDWMGSMSVAIIPVTGRRASALAGELERIFGAQGDLPVAGLVRFLPLDSAGTLIAIGPNPQALDQVLSWVDRVDATGGDAPRIYSYDLKYLGAKDVASRINELLGQTMSLHPGEATISAVEETNSVLVRASPNVWKTLREAIDRIDVMPLQVHLETQIADVRLNDALRHGVSWFFDTAVTAPADEGGAGLPPQAQAAWRSVRGSIQPADQGLGWVFRGKNAAAIVGMLDAVSDVRILQTPSLLVKNNTEALLNAGSRIPVTSVQFGAYGSASAPYSQVQYMDTGLILKVKPRVTREGNVFLEIEQELSTPGLASTADASGNVRIDTNKLKTEVTIRAGDTVMLAGLTRQSVEHGRSGAPGVSRLPLLGGLFGQQRQGNARDELVMLITASVVTDATGLRNLTNDYLKRFRALAPMRTP